MFLPLSGTPPYPTILFGHGLGSGREQGADLAELAAPMGIATVAIPALMHGEHPTNPDPGASTLIVVTNFFAIGDDLETRAIYALRLRDNFRQSTYDKLQLTRILTSSPDVDGDGSADLDGTRLAYLGASLGGIMGPELLALTDAYHAGLLAVPGARVVSIISDSSLFGTLIVLLRPRGTTAGDVDRFFPIMQTVVDRGDSGSYAGHVLRDRLRGDPSATPPSIVEGVALDDDTVPNPSNYALARALDIPIAPVVLRSVPGLVELTTTPIRRQRRRRCRDCGSLAVRRRSERERWSGRCDPQQHPRQHGRCARVARVPHVALGGRPGPHRRPVRARGGGSRPLSLRCSRICPTSCPSTRCLHATACRTRR